MATMKESRPKNRNTTTKRNIWLSITFYLTAIKLLQNQIPKTSASTKPSLLFFATAQQFDPYQLNGGLVSAVAGKDYVIVASDTRLTNGGYGVNSRRYLSGRIWCASSSSSASLWSRSLLPSTSVSSCSSSSVSVSRDPSPLQSSLAWNKSPAQWEPDGSLVMPSKKNVNFEISTALPTITETDGKSSLITSTVPSFPKSQQQKMSQINFPVMIGSAGCASDCESLKRRVRLELDALESSFPSSSSSFDFARTSTSLPSMGGAMGVQSVANLLQQILYGRRGFPFYSFCVVAGIDQEESYDECGTGAVYVYDAIGSFERVAVGSAGTGRELLQPILDRLFSGSSNNHNIPNQQKIDYANQDVLKRDVMAVPARNQRMGVAGSLRPPVETTVNCSWEEAVNNIARAYRSVAEREISVGDEVVICVVRLADETDGTPTVDVMSFPLKKH